MKITKRQLRRIIREATISGGADEQRMAEISLSVKYVAVYAAQLHFFIFGRLRTTNGPEGDKLQTLFKPLKKLEVKSDMIASDQVKRMDDDGNVSGNIPKSKYKAVETEAHRNAINAEETLMQKIENLEKYLYDQSPEGMSYVEAAEDIKTADDLMQWFEDNNEWLQRLSDGDTSIARRRR